MRELKLKDLSKIANDKNRLNTMLKSNKIAIIGMACYLPDAKNSDEFWENMCFARCSIREFPRNRIDELVDYLKKNGKYDETFLKGAYLNSINDFDHEFFNIPSEEANMMSPFQKMFLENVWNTIEDAGYGGDKIVGTNTGIYMGYMEEYNYSQTFMSKYSSNQLSTAMIGSMVSMIPSRISYLFDLRGPSMVIDTACSSSLVAVHTACQAIRNGDCEQAIAGGIQISLFPFSDNIKVGIESMDCMTRAFDDCSDGTGSGEGVGSILLKPLGKAVEDGDHIYAIICGSAINQDGASMGLTAPNPSAQAKVIKKAWENAGIEPTTISYIEAHGTGTRLGDPIEINGLTKAFREFTQQRQFCGIGSVKTNIGHLYGAAGIASLIKAVLCLKNKKIPPSLNVNVPNEKINFLDSPVYLVNTLREWKTDKLPRRCGISSFGFSGTNCHVVLEEYEPKKIIGHIKFQKRIFTLSAQKKGLLDKYIQKYIVFLEKNKDISIDDLCYTASTGRGHYRYRIAIIVKSVEELLDKLREIKTFKDKGNSEIYCGYSEKEYFVENVQIRNCLELRDKDDFVRLCDFYIKGMNIDWNLVYKNEKRTRISLPTYCFDEK